MIDERSECEGSTYRWDTTTGDTEMASGVSESVEVEVKVMKFDGR